MQAVLAGRRGRLGQFASRGKGRRRRNLRHLPPPSPSCIVTTATTARQGLWWRNRSDPGVRGPLPRQRRESEEQNRGLPPLYPGSERQLASPSYRLPATDFDFLTRDELRRCASPWSTRRPSCSCAMPASVPRSSFSAVRESCRGSAPRSAAQRPWGARAATGAPAAAPIDLLREGAGVRGAHRLGTRRRPRCA